MDQDREFRQPTLVELAQIGAAAGAYAQLWQDIREAYEYVSTRRVLSVEAPGFRVYRAQGPDIAIVVYGTERT